MGGKFTKGQWVMYIGGYCNSLSGPNGMMVNITWGANYPHEGKANASLFLNAREALLALEKCVNIMENGGTWSIEDQEAAKEAIISSKGVAR